MDDGFMVLQQGFLTSMPHAWNLGSSTLVNRYHATSECVQEISSTVEQLCSGRCNWFGKLFIFPVLTCLEARSFMIMLSS
jgi:hypothetical protein